ncbi:hypothetical protein CNMCM5623_002504 [Aspergillus felis]|uniref:ATP-grasp domain-containing protein n=1 Tax=Aspergillus felis TaxID=1287682 RepID=A0A8H6QXD6_9EURO|nr:hypothetical protein CNMCM5623_002504 [Aspergillus felis]KAF7181350.1 hypothetical protein CNMCM7691_000568 [Aspergillus felis]
MAQRGAEILCPRDDIPLVDVVLQPSLLQMILEHMGIPTAPFVIVPAARPDHDGQSISSKILNKTPHSDLLKRFPLFIKPNCEGSSKGIYSFSKAHNLGELEDGVQRLQTKYPDQSVIIESFLGGEEYTVSIIGSGKSAGVLGTVHLDWKSVRPADRCYNTADGGPDIGDDYPVTSSGNLIDSTPRVPLSNAQDHLPCYLCNNELKISIACSLIQTHTTTGFEYTT